MIATLALLLLGQADAGPEPVDVVSSASPRATLDGDASTDVLAGWNANDDVNAGTPGEQNAVELGINVRLRATAFSRHAHLDVDYQGRQPIAGNAQNSAIHLLYQAELSADFLDKLFYVGLGRFFAPSAVMLPVDGVRAQVHIGPVVVQAFGGRRAITSTRGNVDFGTFLPAGGGSASLALGRFQSELGVSFSRDSVPFLEDTTQQSFDALSAYLRATGRPFDWLSAGAELALAERASYVLGPTWTSVELTTRTADLFSALAFVDVRPTKTLRLSYDFHFQRSQVWRRGLKLDAVDPALTTVGLAPQFIDNRVRIRWRPFGLGWVGPEVRARVRPDWHEWRIGANADLAPDWAKGFGLRASYTFEKMVQSGTIVPPSDRSYWSASVNWRWRGLDLAVGASNVQRSAKPLGSRIYTPYDDTPDAPVDLSPFVLEAQRILFLRAFYGSDVWFAALDFEQSLADPRERRVFAQLGARLEKAW